MVAANGGEAFERQLVGGQSGGLTPGSQYDDPTLCAPATANAQDGQWWWRLIVSGRQGFRFRYKQPAARRGNLGVSLYLVVYLLACLLGVRSRIPKLIESGEGNSPSLSLFH